MQEFQPFDGGEVMVCAEAFYGCRTQLHIFEGTMNAVTYQSGILNGIVRNYHDNFEPDLLCWATILDRIGQNLP